MRIVKSRFSINLIGWAALSLIALIAVVYEPLSASAQKNYAPDLTPKARRAIEDDWVMQEQVTRHQETDSAAAVGGVISRGRLLAYKIRELGRMRDAEIALKKLDSIQAVCDNLVHQDKKSGKEWEKLFFDAHWVVHELAFSNPLIESNQLLFIRRKWPQQKVHYFQHMGEAQDPGADLCVLTGLSPDGNVRSLIEGKLSPGGLGRPDLSFDGKKVVFPYAETKPESTPFNPVCIDHGGMCGKFDLFEVGIDGAGLRRITNTPSTEETEPCYMPSGRIAFTTDADNTYVQCNDAAPVFSIFSMAADGSDIRRITISNEGEWYPSMLNDGRLIYTHWEYVMKPFESIQDLWSVYPDGTHSQLAYGDHYAFSKGPRAFMEARQVGGTSTVLCVGAGHHNTGTGPILLLDLNKNRGGKEGFTNLTPEVPYPEMDNDSDNTLSDAGWYASPWPLSEDFYLVCYSFNENETFQAGYGLYLLDRFGNKELIYRDSSLSCYSPIPVHPRNQPALLPDNISGRSKDLPGETILADIYRGLPGVKRGTIKYLRVIESLRKKTHTSADIIDMGTESGLDPRAVLGTVPVEEDGSARFLIPPDKTICFEALDEDHLEVRRMRSAVTVRPGETISCVGCHEGYSKTISPARLAAMSSLPHTITPPSWGVRGMDYRRIVQPVLDHQCVSCHDGSQGTSKSFDLRGLKMVAPYKGSSYLVSRSYLNLIKHVSYVHLGAYSDGNLPLDPYVTGSGASRLMKLLKAGHHGVSLPSEDWQALAAWIDCNAPFYGGWDDVVYGGDQHVGDRKVELAGLAPNGYGLACYVDCGVRRVDQRDNGPVLYVSSGNKYLYYLGNSPSPLSYATVIRNPHELELKCVGLNLHKSYLLGLSWWDYDNEGIVQSVVATSGDGSVAKPLIAAKSLPAWLVYNQLPEVQVVSISPELYTSGKMVIKISSDRGDNAVLSEVWLYEQLESTVDKTQ